MGAKSPLSLFSMTYSLFSLHVETIGRYDALLLF